MVLQVHPMLEHQVAEVAFAIIEMRLLEVLLDPFMLRVFLETLEAC